MPSVIVECGFLSNPEEEYLLNQDEYQNKIAWAIYCGVLDYFEKGSLW
ncbi:N-acetylmuramoyl-L-alanine amidase [Caloramator sp. Dgby_cultured_2]